MQISEGDESEEEMDPKVLARIEKISDILSQTNQNLNMFERFLPAYRQHNDKLSNAGDQDLVELKQKNTELSQQLSELEIKLGLSEKRAMQAESKCHDFATENMKLIHTLRDLEAKVQIFTSRDSKIQCCGDYESDPEKDQMMLDDEDLASDRKETMKPCVNERVRDGDEKASVEGNQNEEDNSLELKHELVRLKVSRDRLKGKTRELLRKYRYKRSLLEKRERQLISQKAGLQRLQVLHESLQSSHSVVVDFLGQEVSAMSRLVSLLVDEEEASPGLISYSSTNHSTWYSQLQTLLPWTKQMLVRAILRSGIGGLGAACSEEVLYKKLLRFGLEAGRDLPQELDEDQDTVQLRSIADTVSASSETQKSTLQLLLKQLDIEQ